LAITVHLTEFKEAVHAIEATLKEKWVFDKMEENQTYIDMYKTFAQHCWDTFDKELDWGTVNHYFNSKYDAERKLPDSLIENVVNELADLVNK
jgi:hypothetical protein